MDDVRKAMVVAAQTRKLRGCEPDADLMIELLEREGFDVLAVRGRAATRAGILHGFESLTQSCSADDAAVIYFAGHGGRQAAVRPRVVHYLWPVDMEESTSDDFRGILTDELTVLQRRLTTRTRNVTTILDCCFSGRMSRDPLPSGMKARGIDEMRWPAAGLDRRLAETETAFRELRETQADAVWIDTNPHAVRLLACSAHQRAYEGYVPEYAGIYGFLTASLVTALRSGPELTWQSIGEQVRHRVLTHMPAQRPEITGPITRVVFTEQTRSASVTHPIRIQEPDGSAWLDGVRLFGLEPGETFALAPLGQPVDLTHAPTARIARLAGDAAQLVPAGDTFIPAGWAAHPLRHVRPTGLEIHRRLRDLVPGPNELAMPVRLSVSGPDGELPPDHPVLHAGERVWISVRNEAEPIRGRAARVFANVLDLGVNGRVTVLNTTEPSGIELLPGEEHAIGAEPGGREPGLELMWPAGVAAEEPRFETVMAVFSNRPQDLRGLTEPDFVERDVSSGNTGEIRYAYERTTFLLCPGGSACRH